ncbi:MAG TPA: NYN domain-containing protein [Paracoccaceae bacterium]|nr:NYN domain-containing protein [Paracoccaceae bacterium]
MDVPSRRIAVLIDGDNASATHASGIFEEVAKHGNANVRRLYGDMTSNRMSGWIKQLQPLAILPQQQFAYTTGKNASDITLVIDAMDLMHTGAVDMFCIVSSDSDFTRLAQRLRENGKTVFGFGERKTPEAFRNACDRFIYLENLGDSAIEAREAPGSDAPAGAADTGDPSAPSAPVSEKKEPPSKAAPLILRAMTDLEDEDGWAMLAAIGNRLLNLAPDFDPRNYGLSKLSDVVRKAGAFEIEKVNGNQLRVRQRQRPARRGG